MKVLGLEMSSPEGSIAWCESGEELRSVRFPNDRKNSGLFFESLQECLLRFGNPDRIVVGLGPGSYAGTRIAIATATGLSAASGAQLIGVASLCAMEIEANPYAVIGDARRQAYFFARVSDRRCVDGPHLYVESELLARLREIHCPVLTTESLPLVPRALIAQPSALILTQCATEMEAAAHPLEPIYLREPHITYPKAAR